MTGLDWTGWTNAERALEFNEQQELVGPVNDHIFVSLVDPYAVLLVPCL